MLHIHPLYTVETSYAQRELAACVLVQKKVYGGQVRKSGDWL